VRRHWLISLAYWIVSGAFIGGTLTGRLVVAVVGVPATAEVLSTPTPLPRPTPTYSFTPTATATATLLPTPRPTIPVSPMPKAAASEFALRRS